MAMAQVQPNVVYINDTGHDIYIDSPHHSSTAEEGYLRGRAALVHAEADYVLKMSQAMTIMQEARTRDIENRVLATDAYFRIKDINHRNRNGKNLSEKSSYKVTENVRVKKTDKKIEPPLADARDNKPIALKDPSFPNLKEVIGQIVTICSNFHENMAHIEPTD
jgi:hypothetical protein